MVWVAVAMDPLASGLVCCNYTTIVRDKYAESILHVNIPRHENKRPETCTAASKKLLTASYHCSWRPFRTEDFF